MTREVVGSLEPELDVERLARAMEVAWPGWLDEAPDTDEGRREIREYAETIAVAYGVRPFWRRPRHRGTDHEWTPSACPDNCADTSDSIESDVEHQ